MDCLVGLVAESQSMDCLVGLVAESPSRDCLVGLVADSQLRDCLVGFVPEQATVDEKLSILARIRCWSSWPRVRLWACWQGKSFCYPIATGFEDRFVRMVLFLHRYRFCQCRLRSRKALSVTLVVPYIEHLIKIGGVSCSGFMRKVHYLKNLFWNNSKAFWQGWKRPLG